MTCSQRSTTDVSRQNLGRAKFKEGLETDIWWEIIDIPKKHVFQNNILVTIVSPWAPYPGVRWSSWHQKPHPAPSQIQIIRNKTEFPQNSPSMSELLTFTGFCQNRPYNTSQNPERFFRKFVLMTWLLTIITSNNRPVLVDDPDHWEKNYIIRLICRETLLFRTPAIYPPKNTSCFLTLSSTYSTYSSISTCWSCSSCSSCSTLSWWPWLRGTCPLPAPRHSRLYLAGPTLQGALPLTCYHHSPRRENTQSIVHQATPKECCLNPRFLAEIRSGAQIALLCPSLLY